MRPLRPLALTIHGNRHLEWNGHTVGGSHPIHRTHSWPSAKQRSATNYAHECAVLLTGYARRLRRHRARTSFLSRVDPRTHGCTAAGWSVRQPWPGRSCSGLARRAAPGTRRCAAGLRLVYICPTAAALHHNSRHGREAPGTSTTARAPPPPAGDAHMRARAPTGPRPQAGPRPPPPHTHTPAVRLRSPQAGGTGRDTARQGQAVGAAGGAAGAGGGGAGRCVEREHPQAGAGVGVGGDDDGQWPLLTPPRLPASCCRARPAAPPPPLAPPAGGKEDGRSARRVRLC